MKLGSVFALLAAMLLLIAGCGGGGGGGGGGGNLTGGGGSLSVSGRVLSVLTGAVPDPRPFVSVGGAQTRAGDGGAFLLQGVSAGGNTIVVDSGTSWGVFSFGVPTISVNTDVGDLYVGPDRVTVTGRVANATNGAGLAGAQVNFAGVRGTTNASGVFTLANVAYANSNPGVILDIAGQAQASGFFAATFRPTTTAVSGVVDVGDVLLTPSGGAEVPGTPYNVTGRVQPAGVAANTTVTALEAGTPIRTYVTGTDGRYYLWLPAGTYTLRFTNGAITRDVDVSVTATNVIVTQDVTLP